MATIWLRNTLLDSDRRSSSAIACVLLLPRPLFELFQHWPSVGNWRWVTIVLFVFGVVGIAGNQMARHRHARCRLLQAEELAASVCAGGARSLLGAAWVYGTVRGFDPFHGGEVSYAAAMPDRASCWCSPASVLQPVAVRLVGVLYPAADTTRRSRSTTPRPGSRGRSSCR